MIKIACIVHVYYPDLWPGLADCIRNVLGARCDLFVTGSDESVARIVRADFPQAEFIRCENVGFDVWPFLKVLGGIDLSAYDLVLKLHTKRDVPPEPRIVFNGMDRTGAVWRNELLSFVRTPEAWRVALGRMSEPGVAAVAGVSCILRRNDVPMNVTRRSFDRALALAHAMGVHPVRPQFVGGTMFLARAELLAPLRGRWRAEDFSTPADHGSSTLSHDIERLMGFCLSVPRWRIVDPDGALPAYRRRVALRNAMNGIARFFWQVKDTHGGRRMFKLLRIPVWMAKRPMMEDKS